MTTRSSDPSSILKFADLTLDPVRRIVTRNGTPVELGALSFDLLRFLAESWPRLVSADDLASGVWGRNFVSPENVAQRVMLLRQSLSDSAAEPRYIETVRNKGYRLIPAVETVSTPEERRPPRRWVWASLSLLAAVLLGAGLYSVARMSPQAPAAAEIAPPPNSVAVLPFENWSPDPDDAYFAAGIHEEILSQLLELGSLGVTPRTSVQVYAGTQKSIPEIARELNVRTVMEGSVRYADGRVVVTTRLTDGATNANLWSESYRREFRDIFAIQADVALNVAQALRVELDPAARERVEQAPTESLPAYLLYLSASVRRWRDSPEESRLGIEEVERAVDLDPNFAAAWVLASNLHTVAQYYDQERAREHVALGEQAARRAIDLDPVLGHAHAALGFALSSKGDWVGSEEAYRKALGFNVPLADMPDYGVLQLVVGDFARARAIFQVAWDAVPQNPVALRFLVYADAALGDWEAAATLYSRGTELFVPWREGDDQMVHLLVGRNEVDQARQISPVDPVHVAMLASMDAPEKALLELRRLHDGTPVSNPQRRRDIAIWAARFGDAAFALEAMTALLKDWPALSLYLWLPQFEQLRRTAEFETLLAEIGLVPYWREHGWQGVCRPLGDHGLTCG